MDREQEEMQFLGLLGIIKESIKIIFTWRKIFSQITLALILPLSFIFLAHIEISNLLFGKIHHDEGELDRTKADTSRHNKLSDRLTSDRIELWFFRAVYFILYLIFSLLSTAAVVYTIACVYTSKPITFGRVMSVVPKVWKRLMITFLWSFLAVFVYNLVTFPVFYLLFSLFDSAAITIALFFILLILYLSGFVYISVIWHLAGVISVLEDIYGIQAMFKSKDLIKGKLGVSIAIILWLMIGSTAIQTMFNVFVAFGSGSGFVRLGFAVLCFLLLFKLFLFSLVVQTVIYFVCKSYHHENIDKSALADHLEVYLLAEYIPLKSQDLQLERIDV
ncbi:uncharacterized protein LOC115726497 [Rhodamnia argentea]|uniref:Uncharacterized protein LOC115726497 n=1 Tax=Rhodamnia argentea TaxID=178133 RepID=A0ABM3HCS3_9MYRT|nr:uncharacterized protein LOC115726497 [Rhodamnia argentea]